MLDLVTLASLTLAQGFPLSKRNYSSVYVTMNDSQYVTLIQQCLEYLGYLDMGGNPYGKFGGATSSATQLYQVNHRMYSENESLKIIEYVDKNEESGYGSSTMLDEITFYSIIRSAVNCGFTPKNDSFWGNISIANSYTFFKNVYVPKTVPLEEVNVSMNPNNPIYITSVESKLSSCRQARSGDYVWVISQVANGKRYDIKVRDSWNNFFADINANVQFYHSAFPFVFKEDEINAEDFGNILYGFAGNAGGYSCSELKFGGSLYSKIKSGECDNGTDSLNIQKGYDMYDDVKKDYYYIHITA